MRRSLLRATVVLFGACVPVEFDWLVTETRFRGLEIEVVQPGGYGSLLNVPADRYRATLLPLDTVELEWHVAAPPGIEVPPPLWIVSAPDTLGVDLESGVLTAEFGDLEDCPTPLPLGVATSCLLGEGHRIRVELGGAFTVMGDGISLVIVGSRIEHLSPATCLERLSISPQAQFESCIAAMWRPTFGPTWAALPFDPDASGVPPEVMAQDADTNPEVTGFAVRRERGSLRIDRTFAVGELVGVRPDERITVEPLFAEGSAQTYWVSVGKEDEGPWAGRLDERTETLEYRAWFSAFIDGFAPPDSDCTHGAFGWVVPAVVEPTTLYLDVRDDRAGHAFAELRFIAEDGP